MKIVAHIMTVMAVIAVVLFLCEARAAGQPSADQDRELSFELVDGAIITGRIARKAIGFQIPNGNILKIPVADLVELNVGLNDRPGFVARVEALLKALDSAKTRDEAYQTLIALGPAVAPIVKRHSFSDVVESRAAVGRLIKAYKRWHPVLPGFSVGMVRPVELQSNIRAGEFIVMGTLTTRRFRIVSLYGSFTVKLDEIHRIRPCSRSTSAGFGRLAVTLRDKTLIRGMTINQPLGVQTRYGTMLVPFEQIERGLVAADGKGIRLRCWNFDRIVGALGPGTTISLKTNKGVMDLAPEKIATMAYEPVSLKGHSQSVLSVAFSPDGKRLASGSQDRTIKLWDPGTGKELLTLKGHEGWVCSIAFSPDGKSLVSGGEDNYGRSDRTVKTWDIATKKNLLTLEGHSERVRSVAFSPDGKRLASGGKDSIIKLRDTLTGGRLLAIKGHSSTVRSLAFSPDGKRLASGSWDKTIKLWDPVAGKELLTLKGHSDRVNSIAFSPDGKQLASGSSDKTIKLWDPASGKELLTLKGHSDRVFSVAFSPDGKRLASGSWDKTIKIWDTASGKELFTLRGHSSCCVYSVAFSPDGKRLASGSGEKMIRLWDVPQQARPVK